MKNKSYSALVIFLLVLSGCSSVPKFKGKGDLCGVVVDENNKPIKDFTVYCNSSLMAKKGTLTSETGMFVFQDMPSDDYVISGEKKGYVRLENTKYKFYDRGKIFCSQVIGIEKALDNVEEKILLQEYKEAQEILKTIEYGWGSYEGKVVKYYQDFISKLIKEEKKNARKKE